MLHSGTQSSDYLVVAVSGSHGGCSVALLTRGCGGIPCALYSSVLREPPELEEIATGISAVWIPCTAYPSYTCLPNANQDRGDTSEDEDDPDIAKIKKVQSFFRGWLCRRRWKQIVDEYIRSPHAESMRKRNWYF